MSERVCGQGKAEDVDEINCVSGMHGWVNACLNGRLNAMKQNRVSGFDIDV